MPAPVFADVGDDDDPDLSATNAMSGSVQQLAAALEGWGFLFLDPARLPESAPSFFLEARPDARPR